MNQWTSLKRPPPTYTVEKHGGVTVIFGNVPVDDFANLTKAAPKNAVANSKAAAFLGATVVFGPRDEIDALLEQRQAAASNPSSPQL